MKSGGLLDISIETRMSLRGLEKYFSLQSITPPSSEHCASSKKISTCFYTALVSRSLSLVQTTHSLTTNLHLKCFTNRYSIFNLAVVLIDVVDFVYFHHIEFC